MYKVSTQNCEVYYSHNSQGFWCKGSALLVTVPYSLKIFCILIICKEVSTKIVKFLAS